MGSADIAPRAAKAPRKAVTRVLLPSIALLLLLSLLGLGLLVRRYVHTRQSAIMLYMMQSVNEVVEPADRLRDTWRLPSADIPRGQALTEIQARADDWTRLLFTLHTTDTPPECRNLAAAIERYLQCERKRAQDWYLYLTTNDPARRVAALDSFAEEIAIRERVTDEAYALVKWPLPAWWPW